MTDVFRVGSKPVGAGLLVTAIFRLGGADIAAFERYEAEVLPLLAAHGGTLEHRFRSDDDQIELHVVRFPGRAAFTRYQEDDRRQALAPLFAASGAQVELFEGHDLANPASAGISPALPDALDPRSTALVLIDVQLGFDEPVWGPRNNPRAEAEIAGLLKGWRNVFGPIFHVQHGSTEPDSTLRPFVPGFAFKPEAKPLALEPVYQKAVNSGFIGTTLEADLRAAGVGTVVLVGISTNHCVSTTARMAANLGFRTIVVADATFTFDRATLSGRLRSAEEVHEGALSDLAGEFATIASAADVAAALAAGVALHGSNGRDVPEPNPKHDG